MRTDIFNNSYSDGRTLCVPIFHMGIDQYETWVQPSSGTAYLL